MPDPVVIRPPVPLSPPESTTLLPPESIVPPPGPSVTGTEVLMAELASNVPLSRSEPDSTGLRRDSPVIIFPPSTAITSPPESMAIAALTVRMPPEPTPTAELLVAVSELIVSAT